MILMPPYAGTLPCQRPLDIVNAMLRHFHTMHRRFLSLAQRHASRMAGLERKYDWIIYFTAFATLLELADFAGSPSLAQFRKFLLMSFVTLFLFQWIGVRELLSDSSHRSETKKSDNP
jgi:hypothetical protein